MRVTIIGNGGREHAIAWKLSKSEKIEKIFCIPGNVGTNIENKCENIKIDSIEEIIKFVKNNKIDFTIVGPEKYFIDGIVDEFQKENLKIIGPDKRASLLEGSKIYAKKFAKKYNIQTAKYKDFNDIDNALLYLKNKKFPVVIKADGLAAGKGVIIVNDYNEAKVALKSFMIDGIFSEAGKKVVIEEYLKGYEMSVFVLFDGENYKLFQTAMDHKKIYEREKGPNTGGMGAISPHPKLNEDLLKKIENKIIKPTITGIKEENLNYNGILFIGLIIQNNEPYLLEYNVRFGDPETQAILPLLENDLMEIFEKTYSKELNKIDIKWKDKISCCVVAVSKGYPFSYEKGFEITIDTNSQIFYAGTTLKNGKLLTDGGRVLSVVEYDDNIKKAREKAYNSLQKIKFKNMYYRKDIGNML
ncbi:phosphoribosylamine--glycine ligase [Marinitoga sp. 1197]|uniref:phosphoribosylamine--glycine ligase n=1 Tax=Marinitoga sp. 1197 TaxID=1428449 RepID=UPI0006412F7C|nr:phosphoribosylamine--glycine ligase [Marinitoga sp. 1197]KLO21962.1 phosphoribosylamine--glycine ligase [Marinitoga sp. 1197]